MLRSDSRVAVIQEELPRPSDQRSSTAGDKKKDNVRDVEMAPAPALASRRSLVSNDISKQYAKTFMRDPVSVRNCTIRFYYGGSDVSLGIC
ncbi:hypothetical protein [Actimicrobium sp. CCI2.3]|uniref:hypothetical protein n=1 Tax=Actimicrobium sp. CCI2.3 TaxID=3048616 RepID=UPI002B251E49|nr:hypothetical protein [Actimicrobium sp. CCI2.3]